MTRVSFRQVGAGSHFRCSLSREVRRHFQVFALALAIPIPNAVTQTLPSPITPSAPNHQHDELDMLARARAEIEARRGEADATSQSDEDAGDAIRAQAIEAEVSRRMREAERDAELDQLSASIRRSVVGREAPKAPTVPFEEAVVPNPPDNNSPPPATSAVAQRATILLVMQPGRTGIRALNPTADPILCMPDVCWISRGPELDARMLPRRQALGAVNTLSGRAGACNDRVGCVFRNIEISDASAVLQPVDLRLLKHDRREALEVRVDSNCRLVAGRLACSTEQGARDYRMWVVPETMAQQVGASVLQTAVGKITILAERRSR